MKAVLRIQNTTTHLVTCISITLDARGTPISNNLVVYLQGTRGTVPSYLEELVSPYCLI